MLNKPVKYQFLKCYQTLPIIMEKVKIDRINELGRISKTRELTEEEKSEQKALREEYLAEFRAQLKGNKK